MFCFVFVSAFLWKQTYTSEWLITFEWLWPFCSCPYYGHRNVVVSMFIFYVPGARCLSCAIYRCTHSGRGGWNLTGNRIMRFKCWCQFIDRHKTTMYWKKCVVKLCCLVMVLKYNDYILVGVWSFSWLLHWMDLPVQGYFWGWWLFNKWWRMQCCVQYILKPASYWVEHLNISCKSNQIWK